MKRHLFLTGPIGCGKSTAILTALGNRLPGLGGFLTRRVRDSRGNALSFYLTSPDETKQATFLDCAGPTAVVDLSVFDNLGAALLRDIEGAAPCILDEIGGMELLCPEFMTALNELLASDAPVIGVLKGEGPASAMISRLGLTAEYEAAGKTLRERLSQDPNTCIYHCAQYDPQALLLAEQWAKEYCHA